MSEEFIQLYQKDTDAACAYLLSSGEIHYYLSNSDKYKLSGKSFVIGASEIVLSEMMKIKTRRLETVLLRKDSELKKISLDNFVEAMNTFSFVMNVAMVTARQVVITNQIISENRRNLAANKKTHRDICTEYYKILSVVIEEYGKRKLPWLKEVIEKYQLSLVFKQGEIFSRQGEPVKIMGASALSENIVEYNRNDIIFQEGSDGHDMFILQRGEVDVMVGEHKVASIGDPGVPIGEIALLLGEKRSATLKAANNVVLAKISPSDLKNLADTNISIFHDIVKSLAKKHAGNIETLNAVNYLIVEQNVGANTEDLRREAQSNQKAEMELDSLKRTVSELIFKKDAPFLKDRIGLLVEN